MVDTPRAAIAAQVAFSEGEGDIVVFDAATEPPYEFDTSIAKAREIGGVWVVEVPFAGTVLEQLAKQSDVTVFHTNAVPGSLFATNKKYLGGECSVVVRGGDIGTLEVPVVVPNLVEKRVTKLLKTDEERFVFGVVLVPETTDSQGDIYSHDEVRKAAHGYMENAGALGKQHSEIVTGKLKILESYITPVEFEVDNEQIAKGTWLMAIRIVDDDMWSAVKKGDFTGFSIGGQAHRQPEATT